MERMKMVRKQTTRTIATTQNTIPFYRKPSLIPYSTCFATAWNINLWWIHQHRSDISNEPIPCIPPIVFATTFSHQPLLYNSSTTDSHYPSASTTLSHFNSKILHSPILIKSIGKEIQCFLGSTLNSTSQYTWIKGCDTSLVLIH